MYLQNPAQETARGCFYLQIGQADVYARNKVLGSPKGLPHETSGTNQQAKWWAL